MFHVKKENLLKWIRFDSEFCHGKEKKQQNLSLQLWFKSMKEKNNVNGRIPTVLAVKDSHLRSNLNLICLSERLWAVS